MWIQLIALKNFQTSELKQRHQCTAPTLNLFKKWTHTHIQSLKQTLYFPYLFNHARLTTSRVNSLIKQIREVDTSVSKNIKRVFHLRKPQGNRVQFA